MLFMIWVNDFWSLKEVPKWLQHAHATEDYLGFSDIIFPLFLFIVGLSIPLAIEQRQKKGHSTIATIKHILIRSASLLLIGFLIVNYEFIHADSLPIPRLLYCFIMTLGFALIWMNWKRSPIKIRWHLPLQIVGGILLIAMAFIYKGGTEGELGLHLHWWGILGLIGWAYFSNALIYLITKDRLIIMTLVFLVFTTLSVLAATGTLPPLPGALSFLNIIYTGTIPAFTSAGIVATLTVQKLSKQGASKVIFSLIALGLMNIAFGILTRPIWGISKIQSTPSWLGITLGISFLLFALLYTIADLKKHSNWAKLIAPAGTATLTCYLMPYLVYPILALIGLKLPEFMSTGTLGLLGSFIFAFLIVLLTGLIERKGFKLKL